MQCAMPQPNSNRPTGSVQDVFLLDAARQSISRRHPVFDLLLFKLPAARLHWARIGQRLSLEWRVRPLFARLWPLLGSSAWMG